MGVQATVINKEALQQKLAYSGQRARDKLKDYLKTHEGEADEQPLSEPPSNATTAVEQSQYVHFDRVTQLPALSKVQEQQMQEQWEQEQRRKAEQAAESADDERAGFWCGS